MSGLPRVHTSFTINFCLMADRVSTKVRSQIMSRIRKKWSRIDQVTHEVLKGARIRHKMYPGIACSPDILVFPNVLVFLDGCFWHCCPKCFRPPKSRRGYWRPKLEGNRLRDVRNSRFLRRQGWQVVRIWEHRIIASPAEVLSRLDRLAARKKWEAAHPLSR